MSDLGMPWRQVNQKFAVSVVYVAALFMAIMDSTIVNVALPTLGRQFHTTADAVDGVVIAYLVSLAVFIPTSGWLGDRLGGRRVLLGSIVVFAGASALCGTASSLGELVAFRILQGIGGGLMIPVGMAMLWRVFPPAERVRASSLLVIPTAFAPAMGPVLGGVFVTDVSWRWVFYVNVPIGLAALAFGVVFLADQRLDHAGAFDLPGFLLSGAGLGLLMYGVSEGPNEGWGHWPIAASCVAGVVALAVLAVVELRRREPLLRLRLLRDRLFSVSNTVMVLASIAFTGTVYLVSLFYQDGLGLSALQAGLSTFPEAVGVMLGARIVAKRLYPVLGPRRIIADGLLLTAAGITALLAIGPATSLWWARLVLFAVGLGMSGVFIPAQTAAFATISQEDMGGASTLFNALRQLGGAVGVAVLTTVLVAVGPFSHAGGRLVPDLTSYRAAFLVAAAIALIAAGIAARIRDEDAASTITRWHGRRAGEPSDTGQRGGEPPSAAGHTRPRSHRSPISKPPRRWRRRRLPVRARYRAPSRVRKRNLRQETRGVHAPGRAKASISPGEGAGSPVAPGSVACPAARRVSMARQPKSNMTAANDADGIAELSAPGGGDRPVPRILVFTIVSLALLMMSVDSTIVATALHSLQHELATSINWAGWAITGYSFGFVLMLPVSGKLSEHYGRRRVFLASVITFTAASLCCGLANNIYMLIVLRVVQAAGGAGFTPSATGIVVDYFGDARDRAVSLFGSIFPVGAMIGPIFGGLLVSYWSWRGIFFVNVPIGAAVLVLSLRYIPRDPPRAQARPEMDAAGMALLGTGLLAGMLAASYLGEDNAHPWSPLLVVPLVIAVVALRMFFRHISHSPRPFLAPRLIHGPGFGPVNLVNVIFSGVTFGVVALIPLYATNRYHIGALGSGTLLIAQGAAAILLSIAAALALRRTGHRPPLYAGAIVIAVGMALLALSPIAGIPPYAWLAGSAFLIGVGSGTINPPSRNAGLQLAPEHSSTLAALRSMSLQIGSITTISIATAILTSSNESGTVQAWFYATVALLLFAALPLITRVPEYHGSW